MKTPLSALRGNTLLTPIAQAQDTALDIPIFLKERLPTPQQANGRLILCSRVRRPES
jgi:hypothetical protein